MNIIEFLKKQIEARSKDLDEVRAKIKASESADEVRSLGEQAEKITKSINEARDQLAAEEAKTAEAEKADEGDDKKADKAAEADEARSLIPMATYGQVAKTEARSAETTDERGTMEYRSAFMNFVQRGVKSPILKFEQRANATGVASDLGVLIPSTVVQEVITGVEKVYGQLYSRVKKTNIPGAVKYPLGNFEASFKRITETTVSDRQKAGAITGYVEFSYKIGEIRIARTLLQTVLSVPAFEKELSKVIIEAYVKAMDQEIMNGVDADNECVGILTEAKKTTGSRIPAANIIEFTDADMADWKSWQKKLFAKIPLSMRGLNPEFAMTANTYEANIKTLKDDNNRPVYTETFNPVDGAEISRFKGKNVVFVEEDILKNFDDATNGDFFAMYWVPEKAYAINTNMEFTMVKYFDQETNQYVDKALVINDGKILDPKYLYLLKKKVTA